MLFLQNLLEDSPIFLKSSYKTKVEFLLFLMQSVFNRKQKSTDLVFPTELF